MSHKWIGFEDHILDFATDELLPCMRGEHGFDAEMATRFANRNATTAYNILKNVAQDKTKTVPTCGEITAVVDGHSVTLSCRSDAARLEWDLGDASKGEGTRWTRRFAKAGTYLASVTATSAQGTQNTQWKLITVE